MENEDEFAAVMRIRNTIDYKVNSNIPIEIEEIYFRCDQYTLSACANVDECKNVYYNRLFIHQDAPDELIEYSKPNEGDFERMVEEWGTISNTNQIPGTLEHASSKETKQEIKSLKKEGLTENLFNEKYFKLIAFSRFRYGIIKRIFDLRIKSDKYLLKLNGFEIELDYESYAHIITRHYGEIMKGYATQRDYFYDVFHPEKFHQDFELLFTTIDQSGLFKNDPIQEINFRFAGIIYRIYVEVGKTRSVAGKSQPEIYNRLSTFYPLSATMRNELLSECDEKHISPVLCVFTNKII